MLPTAGLPFLTHLLSRIAATGIEHVVLGTAYKAETFEAEFGDGSKLGLQIDYVVEEVPLGTGGGIANVASKLRNDTVMVFNGDVLSGADLGPCWPVTMSGRRPDPAPGPRQRPAGLRFGAHRRRRKCVGVPGKPRTRPPIRSTPEPTSSSAASSTASRSAGRCRWNESPPRTAGRQGQGVRAISTCPYWRDMGTRRISSAARPTLSAGSPCRRHWSASGESLVHDGALGGTRRPGLRRHGGRPRSGDRCRVRLDGAAVVFDGARIEPGAVVERSIIGFGSRIGPRALIRDGVIGDGADIGARCELLRGARVWPGVLIPDCGIRYSSDI